MKNKNISIIGVPMDLGQTRRGVDMGPSAIRYGGLEERLERLGYRVKDEGDLFVTRPPKNGQLDDPMHAVAHTCQTLAERVASILRDNHFPLVLGGDHSIALGTLAGIAKKTKQLGVIWYDAHGDVNTVDTSPSGNIHGMPLAASLGYGHPLLTSIGSTKPKLKPEHVVMIGIRDLDEGERQFIKKTGIRVYTMHEVDRIGMPAVMNETIDYLASCTDHVHLSLDLDGLDPTEAPGVGTPVPGGLTYRESHLAMEMLSESGLIQSAEFVEVNPILDERNKTGTAAVGLIASLLGEKLL